MRLELTRVGLLVELANHYTIRGAFVCVCVCVCVCLCVCVCVLYKGKLRKHKNNLMNSKTKKFL